MCKDQLTLFVIIGVKLKMYPKEFSEHSAAHLFNSGSKSETREFEFT